MTLRNLRRAVLTAGTLLVVGLFVDQFVCAADAMALTRTRITGRIVSGELSAPVRGAWVMSLPRTELASDALHVAKWRGLLQLEGPAPLYGETTTDAGGEFSFVVCVPWSWREGGLTGLSFRAKTPPPFHGIACLIVDSDGFGRVVVDPRWGKWDAKHTTAGEYATLDMGVITLPGPH